MGKPGLGVSLEILWAMRPCGEPFTQQKCGGFLAMPLTYLGGVAVLEQLFISRIISLSYFSN